VQCGVRAFFICILSKLSLRKQINYACPVKVFSTAFDVASAYVTDEGELLCHAATVWREKAKPDLAFLLRFVLAVER